MPNGFGLQGLSTHSYRLIFAYITHAECHRHRGWLLHKRSFLTFVEVKYRNVQLYKPGSYVAVCAISYKPRIKPAVSLLCTFQVRLSLNSEFDITLSLKHFWGILLNVELISSDDNFNFEQRHQFINYEALHMMRKFLFQGMKWNDNLLTITCALYATFLYMITHFTRIASNNPR